MATLKAKASSLSGVGTSREEGSSENTRKDSGHPACKASAPPSGSLGQRFTFLYTGGTTFPKEADMSYI